MEIFVQNLGKYNEGELVGDWIKLPKTNEEIKRYLKEVVKLDEEYEEYMIGDYIIDIDFEISEYSNIYELNLLAVALEKVENIEAINSYIEIEGSLSIKKIINLVLQQEEIPYYQYDFRNIEYCSNLSKEEKYGYTKAELSGLDQILEKEKIEQFFNYKEYGKEDTIVGDVELFENGYMSSLDANIDLDKYSFKEIKEIKEVEFLKGIDKCSCRLGYGIISFKVNNVSSSDIGEILSDYGICVRTGNFCKNNEEEDSIRISIHIYNNRNDICKFIKVLKFIIKENNT